MKEKILTMIVFATIILLIYIAYHPISIDAEYNGIYFDRNAEDFNKSINVRIVGTVKKNLLLQLESFVGKISIDSSTFEIMQPVEFSRHGRTIGLSLSDEIISIEWKFTDKSGLFNEFIGDMNCFIYFDKKFSMISFLLSFNNGTTSLRREISAPCDSREEAIRLGWYLKSGGIKPPE